jgi:hypothetical protein
MEKKETGNEKGIDKRATERSTKTDFKNNIP